MLPVRACQRAGVLWGMTYVYLKVCPHRRLARRGFLTEAVAPRPASTWAKPSGFRATSPYRCAPMPHAVSTSLNVADVLQLLRTHRRRWLLPTVTLTALSCFYALVKRDTWEASQALIVRPEASIFAENSPQADVAEQNKLKQETILEIVQSRNVLERALREVALEEGTPLADAQSSPSQVEQLKDAVKLSAPKGAEFGMTEIFYLKVKDRSRSRAVLLAKAVYNQLAARFQKLIEARAQSETAELHKAVAIAEADFSQASEKLATLERSVGADLGELRMLHGSPAGESDQRKKLVGVENELRERRAALQVYQELLLLLQAAQEDAGQLLATPNRLLDSQPGLRRLKDGLIDAKLRTAELLGVMSEEHPKVVTARAAEREIGQHIHDELPIAVRGVEADIHLTSSNITMLEEHLQTVRQRLDRLAALRTEYATLSADVDHRTKQCEQARRNLAEARATHAAALSANLISRVDEPDTGPKPVGPGRLVLALAGMAGGFLFGLALVFLTLPTGDLHLPGRRVLQKRQGDRRAPAVAPTSTSAPAPAPAEAPVPPVPAAAIPSQPAPTAVAPPSQPAMLPAVTPVVNQAEHKTPVSPVAGGPVTPHVAAPPLASSPPQPLPPSSPVALIAAPLVAPVAEVAKQPASQPDLPVALVLESILPVATAPRPGRATVSAIAAEPVRPTVAQPLSHLTAQAVHTVFPTAAPVTPPEPSLTETAAPPTLAPAPCPADRPRTNPLPPGVHYSLNQALSKLEGESLPAIDLPLPSSGAYSNT